MMSNENNESEYGTVTFIPSVHYSKSHVNKVTNAVREVEPDVVAVELGEKRYERFSEGEELTIRDVSEDGSGGVAYMLFKAFQEQQIGGMKGFDLNDTDMVAGVRTAAATDTPIALIDDEAGDTFNDIIDNISLEDVPRIVNRLRDVDEEYVEKLEEEQKEMMNNMTDIDSWEDVEFAREYLFNLVPEVAEVVIDQRDEAMAKRIHRIRENGYDVVVIIGAAHHKGILDYLEQYEEEQPDLDTEVPIVEPEMNISIVDVN